VGRAARHQVQNVDHPNPHATDTGLSAELPLFLSDQFEQIGSGWIIPQIPAAANLP
jgi:hypothetical protein